MAYHPPVPPLRTYRPRLLPARGGRLLPALAVVAALATSGCTGTSVPALPAPSTSASTSVPGLATSPGTVAPTVGQTWDQVRGSARVALYSEAALAGLHGRFLQRRVSPGLAEVLVMRTPTSAEPVDAARLAQWGVAEPAALRLAEEQTFAHAVRPSSANGFVAFAPAPGEEHFLTSWLLRPEQALGHVLAHGAVLSAPRRGELILHELQPGEGQKYVQAMASATADSYTAGPGPVSPDLYWWHAGVLTTLTTQDGAVAAFPEVLGALLAG